VKEAAVSFVAAWNRRKAPLLSETKTSYEPMPEPFAPSDALQRTRKTLGDLAGRAATVAVGAVTSIVFKIGAGSSGTPSKLTVALAGSVAPVARLALGRIV